MFRIDPATEAILELPPVYCLLNMSSHTITLNWNRDGKGFGYKEYPRDHDLDFGHGVTLRASAAADYLGTAEIPDPEQAFVASLSSCHMLTFLALASLQNLTLESYTDKAVGYLEKGENGKPVLSRIELHPVTVWAEGITVSAEKLEKLHHKAHEECFLANSVKTRICTVF
ncbi:MAG: OsmC family protein [Verrucomicrobiota bacterium]|nr:OsmC family protein [Verrucomicrobiota bacterium]